MRFVVFSVAAEAAGLAGGLHAINYEIVAAESVSAARSGAVLLMVYIGGVHHFAGAILGAIAITWLQVILSGFTTAWLLYLGLFFMAVVLFVPGGLAGFVTMHAPFVRARALGRVLRAYALALGPALAMTLGAVTLIEMAYRRSTQPEAGARMKLFWVSMDTATPWPWLGAALLALAGYAAWRWISPRVAEAWSLASEEAGLGAARG